MVRQVFDLLFFTTLGATLLLAITVILPERLRTQARFRRPRLSCREPEFQPE
jgi:hypothetical protein